MLTNSMVVLATEQLSLFCFSSSFLDHSLHSTGDWKLSMVIRHFSYKFWVKNGSGEMGNFGAISQVYWWEIMCLGESEINKCTTPGLRVVLKSAPERIPISRKLWPASLILAKPQCPLHSSELRFLIYRIEPKIPVHGHMSTETIKKYGFSLVRANLSVT